VLIFVDKLLTVLYGMCCVIVVVVDSRFLNPDLVQLRPVWLASLLVPLHELKPNRRADVIGSVECTSGDRIVHGQGGYSSRIVCP
jgi:hypothetical protein